MGGAAKIWKLFHSSSCKPHPQPISSSVQEEAQWRMSSKRKKSLWCEVCVCVYFFPLTLSLPLVFWTLLSSAGGNWKWDAFENSQSWAAAFLSWKEQRGRINILRICQRKRNVLCLCAACWWGWEISPSFLNISLSLQTLEGVMISTLPLSSYFQ